ncbi:ribosome-recycling factor, mitochondrial isoform X4 [Pteropus medius]|uniref:ribosome-recycling factor, mitochondrial isoform X4 n=1 Tax=Pteropus vampyrus TaxID=132908 RepID=UPI00196AC387|nr:ribosome-recycling factor, mitochondrial isoform X4 [Pteropus giganteus]
MALSRCSQGLSSVMALGLKCFRLVHPAFCSSLAAFTRPFSEITLKAVNGRQNNHGQYMASPAVPTRLFATKKAKAKAKGQPQTRVNLNTALVEDIISLEEVEEEMKSVMEALKDNFNKTVNIRTSPGSLDHITVVTADGKLALNQIGQISMKSPQLILVNMASFPECTAAAIKAIRESGMNLNPEVEGTLIRVPIPNDCCLSWESSSAVPQVRKLRACRLPSSFPSKRQALFKDRNQIDTCPFLTTLLRCNSPI